MSAEPWWSHTTRIEEAWAPVIAELAKTGVRADVADLAGGFWALHVPLAEDSTRWVWLGTDGTGVEAMWIGQFGPRNFLSGCMYWSADGDEDDASSHPLPLTAVNRDDPEAVARVIRAMVVAAMAIPREDYEWN